MKKQEYMKPQMEVVEIEIHSSMLAGSPNPPGWGGEGGSRELEDLNDMEELML